ncbi:hypothetical protein ONK27_27710, partial [Salmonella enterica subsp. enterica serovar Virginia]|nr:hypothetical protein [Salmonella enterica subsp. enterica serovar Virginia]
NPQTGVADKCNFCADTRLAAGQSPACVSVCPTDALKFGRLDEMLENDYDPRLISAMSEIRNLVEPAIARWAAERATSSDLAEIES